MRLRKPCVHGRYDAHFVGDGLPIFGYADEAPLQCFSGEFLATPKVRYQPTRRWWCFSLDLEEFAVASQTFCRFGREHSVACGWKVLVDADSWRLRSDFGVIPETHLTPE